MVSILDNELKDVAMDCLTSTKSLSKILFPDRFRLPFSPIIHDPIFSLVDDPYPLTAIAAPRMTGKTSIVDLALPTRHILSNLIGVGGKHFIIIVSKSEKHALMQSESLKKELVTNTDIIKLFGPQRSDVFTKEYWITSGNTMIMPLGSGQQIRGMLHGNYRPDLVIIDDVESKEGVRNPEQRRQLKEWLYSDVMRSIDPLRGGKIVFIGTVLSEASLLQELLDSPNWKSVNLRLFDELHHSNWPEYMTDKEIEAMISAARDEGTLDLLFLETCNIPISPETATFKSENFSYYLDSELRTSGKRLENIILYDPARTISGTSSATAIYCVGIDLGESTFYVRDLVCERLHRDEQHQVVFDMINKYHATVLGAEITGLVEHLTYPLKTELIAQGLAGMVELVELRDRGRDKDARIDELAPFYRRKQIKHNKECVSLNILEDQLLSHPKSRYKDASDCLAYLPQILEIGSRYFSPRNRACDRKARDKRYEELRAMSRPPLNIRRSV
jgi:hypothetical protein